MIDGLRECTYKYYDFDHKEYLNTVGYFHQWASSFEEFENGAVEITIGIVENQSTGQIHTCVPEHIMFIDHAKYKVK